MMDFWDQMNALDPGLAERATGLRDYVFRGGRLPQSTKELIYVGICCAMRLPVAIGIHARRALEYGASREEVYEAAAMSLPAAGIPAFREAVTLLRDLLLPVTEGGAVKAIEAPE